MQVCRCILVLQQVAKLLSCTPLSNECSAAAIEQKQHPMMLALQPRARGRQQATQQQQPLTCPVPFPFTAAAAAADREVLLSLRQLLLRDTSTLSAKPACKKRHHAAVAAAAYMQERRHAAVVAAVYTRVLTAQSASSAVASTHISDVEIHP
jgi:hypothetical protein